MNRAGRPVVKLKEDVLRDSLARNHRSLKWLAGELGISRGYLWKLLKSGRAPSGRVRQRMQDALGLEEFDDLFYLERAA